MRVKPHTFCSLSNFSISGIILRKCSKQNRHNHHSLVISAPEVRCDWTQVRILPRAVVFITTAAAIYSLGHGLQTFTAVPLSTQPSALRETVKWVSAFSNADIIAFYFYTVREYSELLVKNRESCFWQWHPILQWPICFCCNTGSLYLSLRPKVSNFSLSPKVWSQTWLISETRSNAKLWSENKVSSNQITSTVA